MAKQQPESWKIVAGGKIEKIGIEITKKTENNELLAEARSVINFFNGLKGDWVTTWDEIVSYYEPLSEYEKGVIKNKSVEELNKILEEYVRNWDPQNGPQIEGEPQPVYIDEVAAVLTERLREAGY